MKKRLISLLLVVVMLVGMMPALGITINAATTDEEKSFLDEVKDAGAQTSDYIIGLTDFENFSATDKNKLGTGADVAYDRNHGTGSYYSGNGNSVLYFRKAVAGRYEFVAEEDGNTAMKYTADATGGGYIEFQNGSLNGTTTYITSGDRYELAKGRDLVFQMDIKLSEDFSLTSDKILVQMLEHQTAATKGLFFIGADGSIKVSEGWSATYAVGTLSDEKYTNIMFRMNTKTRGVEFYVNGVLVKSYSKFNNMKSTAEYFAPAAIRMANSLVGTGSVYIDNIACYYDSRVAEVNGYNLSLEGNIGVQTYVNINEALISDAANVKAVFTVDGETTEQLMSAAENTTNGYKFVCKVAAPQMTSKIDFKLYDGETLLVEDSYSVVEYARTILADSAYAAAQPVVRAMLNYGASSQKVLGHNLDNMANARLSNSQKTVADNSTAINDAAIATATANITGVAYKTTALELQSETVIYHRFTVTDENKDNYEVVGAEIVDIVDGVLTVKTSGIAAANLSTGYEVSVTYGGATITVTANAMAYAKAIVNMSAYDGTVTETLANALYAYNAAMVAYNG